MDHRATFQFQPEWDADGPQAFGALVAHRFLAGGNKYIHHETTFWRRSLWEKAGGALATEYGVAGEFELFMRFFRHARLYSVEAFIGGYRTHPGNHSASGSHRAYNEICDGIADRELAAVPGAYAAKLFRNLTRIVAYSDAAEAVA